MEYIEIVDALRAAQSNNSREWYLQQKSLFAQIHSLLTELYYDVANELSKEVLIDIAPRKSIARPYNDQRFGHKPYLKDSLWVTFQSNAHPAPAFFIEFSVYGIRLGMGYYSATPAQMCAFREKIDADPHSFSAIFKAVLRDETMQLMGKAYKKRYASPYGEWLDGIYNHRNIYFQRLIAAEESQHIPQIAKETFAALTPAYQWFIS